LNGLKVTEFFQIEMIPVAEFRLSCYSKDAISTTIVIFSERNRDER
jgi:hypothetical protein